MLHATDLSNNVRWSGVCQSSLLVCIIISSTVNRLNYTWINQDRKSVNLPAPTYIDYVMTWVQNLLDDENAFPTKSGVPSVTSKEWVNSSQVKISRPIFRQRSNTSIASFFEFLHTYTTYITRKFYISVQSRILIRFSHISWHLERNMSCWT